MRQQWPHAPSRLRPHAKRGKLIEMPRIKTGCIAHDREGPLFRSAIGKTGALRGKPMLRGDVSSMVRRPVLAGGS
jgi:hypothetical protein